MGQIGDCKMIEFEQSELNYFIFCNLRGTWSKDENAYVRCIVHGSACTYEALQMMKLPQSRSNFKPLELHNNLIYVVCNLPDLAANLH